VTVGCFLKKINDLYLESLHSYNWQQLNNLLHSSVPWPGTLGFYREEIASCVMSGGTPLHERTVITGMTRWCDLQIVLGTREPMPVCRVGMAQINEDGFLNVTPDQARSLMLRSRQDVTVIENNKAPLQMQTKATEMVIQVPPVERSRFRRLVNAVDIGDFTSFLSELLKLGLEAPRLGNILVCANLSADPESIQFVGQATADCWMSQDGGCDGVVSEQRIYSLIGLAWRRRHFIIYNTLKRYDKYAKSGHLLHLFYEHRARQDEVSEAIAASLPNCTKTIILGYMDTFFPHSLVVEQTPLLEPEKGTLGCVESQIMSEEVAMSLLSIDGTYYLLGAERTPDGNVFGPWC
jgi:hypothetical protein